MAYDPFFDAKFYTKKYPDLAHLRPDQAAVHYRLFGKREGRLGRSEDEEKSEHIVDGSPSAVSAVQSDNKFNILIRTCLRPNYFEKCMQSILSQTYSNFRVWISYDKQESYDYIQPFVEANPDKVSAHYINMDEVSTEKYRFNLYCNVLMDMVSEGYIIFLDDDDLFARDDALERINRLLIGHNAQNMIVLWQMTLPHGVVYPRNAPAIVYGGIDTGCVCFHSSHKHKSRWPDKRAGDFAFFSGLMKSSPFQYRFVPLVLTKSIYTGTVSGNGFQGEKE